MLKFVSILMFFVLMYKIYVIRVDKIFCSKAINRNRIHSKFRRECDVIIEELSYSY